MNENTQMTGGNSRPMFSPRNLLKILTILCIVFVFCPSFLVSCSGEKLEISAWKATTGMTMYGEKIDSHPIMIIALLIPLIAAILLFLKNMKERTCAGVITATMAIDFVVWLMFKSSTKEVAQEHYCEFDTTAWYPINLTCIILTIIISLLVLIQKIRMDADIVSLFSSKEVASSLEQVSKTVTQMSSTVSQIASNVTSSIGNKPNKEDIIGYCSKCGAPLLIDNQFCTSCGAPVASDLLAEAEKKKKEREEAERIAQEKMERERAEREERERREREEAERLERERKEREQSKPAPVINAEVSPSVDESSSFIFCPYCGTKQDSDAMFCVKCGKKM